MNAPANASRPPSDAMPVNVLIVDDIRQNLIAMEALLQTDGVHVLLANSGSEALELLLTHEVALALLDVQMPEMDGFALAELMRGSQKTRDVPIIFLTASPSDPIRSFKGYETGAVDFLHKPIDPYVIVSKARVFIELYRQRILLRCKNQQLEKALKLNETMIAVLSHDLRAPLSVIVLCADVLSEALSDESPFTKNVTHMRNSAHRMSRMIGQLLDFSRIRSDVLQLQVADADLSEVTKAVLDEIRVTHSKRTFSCSLAGSFAGRFDRERIAQVIQNLVGNAIEHGEAEASIDVSLDGLEEKHLVISVTNSGTVPVDLLPRIFEPFKPGHPARGGLGLGLYIVDQFIRAHHGRIEVLNLDGSVVFRARFLRRIHASPAEVLPG